MQCSHHVHERLSVSTAELCYPNSLTTDGYMNHAHDWEETKVACTQSWGLVAGVGRHRKNEKQIVHSLKEYYRQQMLWRLAATELS